MEELFVMWQPVLIRKSEGSDSLVIPAKAGIQTTDRATLHCFLTELSVSLVPVNSIVLAQCLLDRLKLKGDIAGWQLKECLTDYATPPEDLDADEDRWRKAWIVEVELENPSPSELVLKNESLFLAGPRIGEYRPAAPAAEELPYLIVADFADEESRSAWLKGVEKLLPKGSFEAMTLTLSGEELSVFQARLEVKVEHGKLVKKIEDQCAKHEGYTNYTTRADEADEVYNPDGID